jgi:hypothetical protein
VTPQAQIYDLYISRKLWKKFIGSPLVNRMAGGDEKYSTYGAHGIAKVDPLLVFMRSEAGGSPHPSGQWYN